MTGVLHTSNSSIIKEQEPTASCVDSVSGSSKLQPVRNVCMFAFCDDSNCHRASSCSRPDLDAFEKLSCFDVPLEFLNHSLLHHTSARPEGNTEKPLLQLVRELQEHSPKRFHPFDVNKFFSHTQDPHPQAERLGEQAAEKVE